MKKYLLTGIVILLPVAITIFLINWLIDLLTEPFMGIVKAFISMYESNHGMSILHHEGLILFLSRIIILIFLFALVLFLGIVGQKYKDKLTSKISLKIPFVSSVYRVSKEVTKALFSSSGKTFKQTVLVPFPKEDTYAIGLVTGDPLPAFKEKIKDLEFSVFIPTSPHPVSGYMLMVKKKDAIPLDITTEEAFKLILTCGAVNPGEQIEKPIDLI